MSKNLNEITGHKLAGLNLDLMSKMRDGNVTVMQLENFLQLSFSDREEKFGRVIDIWHDSKQSNKKFFKEVFDLDIDTNIAVPDAPDDFTGLLYIPQIKGDTAVNAYKKLFGESSVYENDHSNNIDEIIKTQQERPNTPYFIRHRNGLKPDKVHLKKSYNDFCGDGNKYMIPLEGILFALYYRWSTGNMVDVKGVTIFHALDSGGFVLGMFRSGVGQFRLGWSDRDVRFSDRGPRQVNF